MSEKAIRLLRIYSRLRRGPVTIDTIRDWARKNNIQVSDRSLYRDLSEIARSIMLEGERIVVFEGEKNKKTWKIEFKEGYRELTEFDINSFNLFKNFAPLALVNARSKFLEKIETLFYASNSKSRFEKFSETAEFQLAATHFYELPYTEGYNQLLQDCIWSIQNQRKLQLRDVHYDYTSVSASIKFPLDFLPLQLLYHRGCIYLAGYTDDDRPLILAIEQIRNYGLTNDMFDASSLVPLLEEERSNRFGVSENMTSDIYDIELEFAENTGSFVSNHFWHPSQQFTRMPNGNFIMKLKCGINRELVGWLFQWMSNARVIKPVQLKNLVQAELEHISGVYSPDFPLVSHNNYKPA